MALQYNTLMHMALFEFLAPMRKKLSTPILCPMQFFQTLEQVQRLCYGNSKRQTQLLQLEVMKIHPPATTRWLWVVIAAGRFHFVGIGGRTSFQIFLQMPGIRVRRTLVTVGLSEVEVLSLETQQWHIAKSLPQVASCPQLVLCGKQLYTSCRNTVHSCSFEELLGSCFISGDKKVWTRLTDTPHYDVAIGRTCAGYWR